MIRKKAKRRVHTMLVRVTAPSNLTAAQVRREVKWNIKDQSGYLGVDNEGNDFSLTVRGIKGVRA